METEKTSNPTNIAGRLDGLVMRLREAASNKALDIGTAWNFLDEAADAIEKVFLALECESECPCCLQHVICEEGCTFEDDVPEGYEKMMLYRYVFNNNGDEQ